MIRSASLFFILFFMGLYLSQGQSLSWVFFTDKGPESQCLLQHPEKLLSRDALILRRQKDIPLTEEDLPVYDTFIHEITLLGAAVKSSSRWLNAVAIEASPARLRAIADLDFVTDIRPVATLVQTGHGNIENGPAMDYGSASAQNAMINIAALHDRGFTGRGIVVAVFDAGFKNVDRIAVFDSLWAGKRVLAWHDFVDGDSNVFDTDNHGTQVLSTMAAYLPGQMVGTAPDATYILARTEQSATETRQEEHNWVAALEWADSIGVDIVHTSLGYSIFDDEKDSYTQAQMDGQTSIITQAANKAAAKGILVTCSAGNEGNNSWRSITAPCDAEGVLCIGSVDFQGSHSSFSSYGPSSDGRVKPDVVALGTMATFANPNGQISRGNGTSYAAPTIAGFAASLKQAHPDRPAQDIINAIRLSSNQIELPDSAYGYGIPNAAIADSLLTSGEDLNELMEALAPAVATIALTTTLSGYNTLVSVTDDQISLSTGKTGAKIEGITIKRKRKFVVLAPDEIQSSDHLILINKSYLLKGKYKFTIKTDQYEETIPIKVK